MPTDEQAAHRTRRGNVRRAHRASATRFMNQIDAAIESKNTRQLKQLKQSLTDKLSVLMQLDYEPGPAPAPWKWGATRGDEENYEGGAHLKIIVGS